MGSNNDWDAEQMFQKYLHDYLIKKNMHKTAEIFANEANADVCPVVPAIDSPEGFLVEWWSIFYDVFLSMQLQHEEAVKRVLNKGKQVSGNAGQNLCPVTSKFEKNQQSSGHFPVGNAGRILPHPGPKAYDEGKHRHAVANSQFINADQNHSKSAGNTRSNPQQQFHKQAQQWQEKKRGANFGSTPMGLSIYGGSKSTAIKQVRFQPQQGRLLATAAGNGVNMFDVETGDFLFDLKGHHSEVRSISWDVTGKYIASVSKEDVRLWSVLTGGKCIYECHYNGNNFQSCTFHPGYPLILVIGSYQSLCLWNPSQSSTMDSVQAHRGLVASLASSPATGLIASASHDQCVKLWR